MAQFTIQKEKRQTQYFVEDLGAGVGIDMVQILGGRFMMGSPKDEEGYDDERPQHPVTVPDLFMGRYPVTQAQWRRVAAMKRADRDLQPDPSNFKGDKRPVEQVSWYDAVEFCARLTIHTGREYRLPSEAEWEYACRAGTITPFYFGQTLSPDLANYNSSVAYGDGPTGESPGETTEVDLLDIANAFGLCEMHGNVSEWCLDHWHENYEGAPKDGSPWLKENDEASRVRRGGSWAYNPRNCRSADRLYYAPGDVYYVIGFRVVCSPQ